VVWRHNGVAVAGKTTAGEGFILRKSLDAAAPTSADPEFAAALTVLIFELSGKTLPGITADFKQGHCVAQPPLLEVLPAAAAPLTEQALPSPVAWAGWLFVAALLAFAADAFLYAKNRNP